MGIFLSHAIVVNIYGFDIRCLGKRRLLPLAFCLLPLSPRTLSEQNYAKLSELL